MAVQSNFSYKGVTFDAVTFKIIRVYGSKAEGWNAVVAFVPVDEEFDPLNYKGTIHIGAEWSDANPYPILYGVLEDMLTRSGYEFKNDNGPVPHAVIEIAQPVVESELVMPEVEEVAPEPKPKKTRTKKVK